MPLATMPATQGHPDLRLFNLRKRERLTTSSSIVEETLRKSTPDIEILGPDDATDKAERVKARFWPTVKKALRIIPFMDEVVAAYYAMLDPRTPPRSRLILIAALAYFVTPFDIVPDFILGLGFIDD